MCEWSLRNCKQTLRIGSMQIGQIGALEGVSKRISNKISWKIGNTVNETGTATKLASGNPKKRNMNFWTIALRSLYANWLFSMAHY